MVRAGLAVSCACLIDGEAERGEEAEEAEREEVGGCGDDGCGEDKASVVAVVVVVGV